MFKKPFKVKSNTQLKGSDRRNVRAKFCLQFPGINEEVLNTVMPSKDTMNQLKIVVHSGEILIVYCLDKLPIIFEIEKVWYPTVYLLWHIPDLLHTFTTHPTVFPIIAGGADLMLPGVVLPGAVTLHSYGKLRRGDRVAINLTNNLAPIAVGTAAHSSDDMYMANLRGKCVNVLHFYGDQLSTFGTKLRIPEMPPPSYIVTNGTESLESSNEQNVEALIITTEIITLEPGEKPNSHETLLPAQLDLESSNDTQESEESLSAAVDVAAQSTNSSESMDELLRHCFCKSLRTTMKKVDLPLLTSNFYKVHMIPACPNGKSLDIKKSSYKKLSNFLDEMVKLGAIQIESLQKGVQTISKVDYNNEFLKGFVDKYADEEKVPGLEVDTTQTTKCSAPEIIEKFTVTAATLPLFYNYDYKKKDAVSAETVRKSITDYVKVNNLQNTMNRKEVRLDAVLKSATNAPADKDMMPWDQLVSSVFAQMGQAFKVELGNSDTILTKGKLSPIDIQVGTRSGNKKVTLVNNLELYSINVAEFAKECSHGVAASTTINNLPGAKSAQVQVQGNQVIFVSKLLMEKYKIPKKYLRGLDNAPKKKK